MIVSGLKGYKCNNVGGRRLSETNSFQQDMRSTWYGAIKIISISDGFCESFIFQIYNISPSTMGVEDPNNFSACWYLFKSSKNPFIFALLLHSYESGQSI